MIADFYESESVRVIVALVSVVFTLIYIQVQATGLGYILSVATGDRIPFGWASLILLVVAAGYLMVGGLRAVYWTDVIQGIWMYIAVWGREPRPDLQAVRRSRPAMAPPGRGAT